MGKDFCFPNTKFSCNKMNVFERFNQRLLGRERLNIDAYIKKKKLGSINSLPCLEKKKISHRQNTPFLSRNCKFGLTLVIS